MERAWLSEERARGRAAWLRVCGTCAFYTFPLGKGARRMLMDTFSKDRVGITYQMTASRTRTLDWHGFRALGGALEGVDLAAGPSPSAYRAFNGAVVWDSLAGRCKAAPFMGAKRSFGKVITFEHRFKRRYVTFSAIH